MVWTTPLQLSPLSETSGFRSISTTRGLTCLWLIEFLRGPIHDAVPTLVGEAIDDNNAQLAYRS